MSDSFNPDKLVYEAVKMMMEGASLAEAANWLLSQCGVPQSYVDGLIQFGKSKEFQITNAQRTLSMKQIPNTQLTEQAMAEQQAASLIGGKPKPLEIQTVIEGKVERYGTAVAVPLDMTLSVARDIITQAMEYDEKKVSRSAEFEQDPYEVAHAFSKAIRAVTGTVMGRDIITTWFEDIPPHEISLEVAPGEFVKILWGEIVFPFDPENGKFETGFKKLADGSFVGQCGGVFKQKYSQIWDDIVLQTKHFLETESLFKGRTLRVRFLDANGEPMPMPEIKPWDVKKATMARLVFAKSLENEIEDHILTPIRHREACEAAGNHFKRGVLLAGPFGTGKTELAAVVAKEGAEHGLTVIYIEDVSQLPNAIRFAARCSAKTGAIVFAEDLDRITDGERDHSIDVLLNTLDGIDTKLFPVMTILTTNYPDRIYKGMVRPGRIDVALQIMPPDAEAAIRLVQAYLGEMFDQTESIVEMGRVLDGYIPAVIHEVCKRSKLSSISRTGEAPGAHSITPEDVIRAAGSMQNQLSLLNPEEDKIEIPTLDLAMRETVRRSVKEELVREETVTR